MCSVLCQSPKVYRSVQGIWQRQGMPEDAHRTTAPCSSAPEKRPNKAHEELGLWKRLQIQPHVQGTCGAGLSTRRVERNRLLQGTKNVTAVLRMGLDFMTHTFPLGSKFPLQCQLPVTLVKRIKPPSLLDTFLSFYFYCCCSEGIL